MKRDLGNVEYDADAALYPGASYQEETDMFSPEILLVDGDDELLDDAAADDKKLLEARMIAKRIKELMGTQKVTDKATGELRPVQYSDMVILLRSLSGYADRFAAVLNDAGIPAHTVSATGYFSTVEVQTVLSMLRILDNPRQDIPLTAVLRSPIAGLSDEELAKLRLKDKDVRFYECVLEECERLKQEAEENPGQDRDDSEEKLYRFYVTYEKLRQLVPDTPIHELIELLLKETGYGDYAAAMPAGDRRHANLLMLVEKAIAYENTSYKGLFHFVRYIDELQKYDVDFGEADLIGENENVVRIMSIHKSKGLEFPVVFAAGMGKNFNRQDTRSRLVLHPELGICLDYMDGKQRVKSVTIAKRAIAKQIDMENLGEELRVLYVALTRAKEKLILTGSLKKAEETLSYIKAFPEELLSYLGRESAAGYLDWILPAAASCQDKYQIRLMRAAELVQEELETQIKDDWNRSACMEKAAQADEKKVQQFSERFHRRYAYENDVQRKNKYSVSELKHRAMREAFEKEEEAVPVFQSEEVVPYVPAFAREIEQQSEDASPGALRGTAMHRIMECYQFSSGVSAKEQVAGMLEKEQITPEMHGLIRIPQVEYFVNADIGKRMGAAEKDGKLYREKPFVMGFTDEQLDEFGFAENTEQAEKVKSMGRVGNIGETEYTGKELTLIQGIIDVFWIEKDGIVLLDYKTDRVDTEKELSERYAAQLKLYEEALNRVYENEKDAAGNPLKVKEKLLYSFRLGKVIPV